jgi:molybdate transport system substrate-binding protein
MKSIVPGLLLISIIFTLWAEPAHAGDINLFAAASLREAVTMVSADFSKNNPGVKFRNNFAASGALAKQIENGAPADIFLSANVEWMDYLKEKKLVDEKSITTFTYNTLVFVGKPELKVGNLQEVIRLEKITMGSPRSVPAGDYAMQALKKAGLDKQLENKLVMAMSLCVISITMSVVVLVFHEWLARRIVRRD